MILLTKMKSGKQRGKMRIKDLIQPLVGTEKIIVEGLFAVAETKAFVIVARPPKGEQSRCGICGRKSKYYDKGHQTRRWRCNDIGAVKMYVEAQLPRVSCKKHGVVTSSVPWARHGSRFCKSFEETVVWLSVHASKTAVSELMRIEWHTVGDLCGRIYKEREAKASSRFDGLVNIGIDETSYKKGHKYMTVVVNHDTASVVWCAKGYGKEVLSLFFEQLSPEQRASIRCVSADGARWIASCVEKYCPIAERCVDPFHVVSWATEALDMVRRQVWAEAHKTAKLAPKRGRGRPTKSEVQTTEKDLAKGIKNSRYALLKNPEHLSENQQSQLEFLTKANPSLYRAYLLKENLRLALKAGPDEIAAVLNKWLAWAQRCRIPVFRELRLKIQRHFHAILAAAKHHLSNARVEAINNKIKLLIRTAYGFRNTDNMIAMIMLSCSSVHPTLPGR